MPLFEITLVWLAIAVVLLQVARRLRVPYPAMLALIGGCVAALPFAPRLSIEPQLALALFVAAAGAHFGRCVSFVRGRTRSRRIARGCVGDDVAVGLTK
jgi:membrane protein DedA with SNARE-associated domain